MVHEGRTTACGAPKESGVGVAHRGTREEGGGGRSVSSRPTCKKATYCIPHEEREGRNNMAPPHEVTCHVVGRKVDPGAASQDHGRPPGNALVNG